MVFCSSQGKIEMFKFLPLSSNLGMRRDGLRREHSVTSVAVCYSGPSGVGCPVIVGRSALATGLFVDFLTRACILLNKLPLLGASRVLNGPCTGPSGAIDCSLCCLPPK